MNEILALIPAIGVLAVLASASYHDLRERTIPIYLVGMIYILIPVYLVLAGKDMTVGTVCFGFTFIAFIAVWGISKQQFGLGDVLILSALGWMIADLALLKAYLVVLGVLSIPYAIFCIWYYKGNAKFQKKYSKDPYLYPYMPLIFITTMLYILIPSIFISIF